MHLTTAIRLVNAVLWTAYVIRVVRAPLPVTPLARKLIGLTIVFGMWALFYGGVASLGFVPGDTARTLYSIFTAYAAIVALALLTGKE